MEDEEGKTALHYASSSKGQLARHLVEMLLNDGSDIGKKFLHCKLQNSSFLLIVNIKTS